MAKILPFLSAFNASILVGIFIGKYAPYGLTIIVMAIVSMGLCICSFVVEMRGRPAPDVISHLHDDDRPNIGWDE